MAKDCLVTKLKGVVDNNKLPRFGYIRLKFIGGPNSNQREGYINIKGVGYIYDSNFNLLKSWTETTNFHPDNITLGQKNIRTDNGETKYVDVPVDGFFRYEGMNIHAVNGINSLDGFSYCPNLYSLDVRFSPFLGNIASIKSNKIMVLKLGGSQIEGTIESLAESQITLGRNSGNLRIERNRYVTFNGTVLSADIIITFSTTGCVVKKGDNTLGTYTIGSGWTYNS